MLDAAKVADTLRQEAANDRVLARLGRRVDARVLLGLGETQLHLDIERGAIADLRLGHFMMRSWQFALRARPAAWAGFWAPMPKPGYQDIFAMSRFGRLAIDGDMAPLLHDLRYFKHLLALPRGRID